MSLTMRTLTIYLFLLTSSILAEPFLRHTHTQRELQDQQSCLSYEETCGTLCCNNALYYQCYYDSSGYSCYYNPPSFTTPNFYTTSTYTDPYYGYSSTTYYYGYSSTSSTTSPYPTSTYSYTNDDDNTDIHHHTTSSSKGGKGKAAGAAVGAIVAVAALIGACITWIRRRRARTAPKIHTQPEDPVTETPVTETTVYPKQAQ